MITSNRPPPPPKKKTISFRRPFTRPLQSSYSQQHLKQQYRFYPECTAERQTQRNIQQTTYSISGHAPTLTLNAWFYKRYTIRYYCRHKLVSFIPSNNVNIFLVVNNSLRSRNTTLSRTYTLGSAYEYRAIKDLIRGVMEIHEFPSFF